MERLGTTLRSWTHTSGGPFINLFTLTEECIGRHQPHRVLARGRCLRLPPHLLGRRGLHHPRWNRPQGILEGIGNPRVEESLCHPHHQTQAEFTERGRFRSFRRRKEGPRVAPYVRAVSINVPELTRPRRKRRARELLSGFRKPAGLGGGGWRR